MLNIVFFFLFFLYDGVNVSALVFYLECLSTFLNISNYTTRH